MEYINGKMGRNTVAGGTWESRMALECSSKVETTLRRSMEYGRMAKETTG